MQIVGEVVVVEVAGRPRSSTRQVLAKPTPLGLSASNFFPILLAAQTTPGRREPTDWCCSTMPAAAELSPRAVADAVSAAGPHLGLVKSRSRSCSQLLPCRCRFSITGLPWGLRLKAWWHSDGWW